LIIKLTKYKIQVSVDSGINSIRGCKPVLCSLTFKYRQQRSLPDSRLLIGHSLNRSKYLKDDLFQKLITCTCIKYRSLIMNIRSDLPNECPWTVNVLLFCLLMIILNIKQD